MQIEKEQSLRISTQGRTSPNSRFPGRKGLRGAARLFWALALVTALLSSCGYHFALVGGILPPGAKTIAIPVFNNDTMEPYIDVEVTKAVVEEFLTDGRLKIVGVEAADLVLKGHVTRFDQTPAAYTPDSYAQSYNVGIGVSVTLEDVKTGKVLLQDKGIGSVFIQNYVVTLGNISATKIAKDAAVISACQDLASSLRSRVLDGF